MDVPGYKTLVSVVDAEVEESVVEALVVHFSLSLEVNVLHRDPEVFFLDVWQTLCNRHTCQHTL